MQKVGTAVLRFERGEIQLALLRRGRGFAWFHDGKLLVRPLATPAAAVRFLNDLCRLYNVTVDSGPLQDSQFRS